MIWPSSRTQPSRSSRVFHTRPSRPPGRSTRATSGIARSGIHPVPRLGDQHRVNAVVLQRNLFGGARAAHESPAARCAALPACRESGRRPPRPGRVPPAGWSACRCRHPGRAPRGRRSATASRSPPADTTGGHARRRPPPSRTTGSGRACERVTVDTRLRRLQAKSQCLADQFADRLGFHQEAVVPADGVDDLQPGAARQQLGQLLLQAQRVEPVGGDAADHGRYRAAAQRVRDPAAAAADVVAGQRLGQRPRSCRRRSGPAACRPGVPGSSAPRSGRRPTGSSSPWPSLANRLSSSTSPR